MNPSVTIPTAPLEHPAMDYAFLRSEGIRLLERLGGQVWTDFNAHDPGITILEQLCYAITDLGYRVNYDIKDLLAGEENPYRSIFSPAKVLTTNPVTLTDLRKMLIDVDGVKNAWIEPVEKSSSGLVYDPAELALYLQGSAQQPPHRQPVPLSGLYRILIETDESLGLHPADIQPEVIRRLLACRSLSEDFTAPVFLDGEGVVVNAKIEIGPVENPEQLLAQIYVTLANAISPRIRFYRLSEMLDQGKSIDEIFDGPALEHGFLKDSDLDQFQRKIGLRASDLLQTMMDIPGVTAVNNISLATERKTEDWYLTLDTEKTPFLDIDKSLFTTNSIRLTRGGIDLQLQPARVKENIQILQKAASNPSLPESERDVTLAPGKDRQASEYHSFQYQFPALYGIGASGLPESVPPERKAQSKQLKAYLMFFDQLLANYFAQLGNAKALFSFYTRQPRTYYTQIIADADLDLDEIRVNNTDTHNANLQAMTEDLSANSVERKNRFLNHLLARFAEQFTDYSLLQYAHLENKDLIEDKSAFLQDYPQIGMGRNTGFDYSQPVWGSDNISGLEKRISRKLGISSYTRQSLTDPQSATEGGFHILEHILLRPRQADLDALTKRTSGTGWQTAFLAQPESKDPYSHQLSFIFPDWLERFNLPGFRELILKTLREETPAHIRISVHWLNLDEMTAFESAMKTGLEMMMAVRLWDTVSVQPGDDSALLAQLKLRDARDRMAQILSIGFPYPLRDLKLIYTEIVAYNNPTTIQIFGGQAGVRYQLCDEDGNIITDAKGGVFEVLPADGQATDAIFLPTPPIQKDITFTILAIREPKDSGLRLEAYLIQSVGMKAGIDTRLPVAFQPADGQIASPGQIITNYNDKVTVVVSNSQEGISYKLVMGPTDAPVVISTAKKGNKGDIALVSTSAFAEDTPINVLAYRTTNAKISALLDASLSILVRPDPSLTIQVDKLIVDYNTSATLTLVSPQASVEYRLFKRDIVSAEYLATKGARGLTIHTDEGRDIVIQIPATVTDWDNPSGFVSLDLFKDSKGTLTVSTGGLLEDTLLIVQATKIVNRQQLQLTQTVAILARPNPAVAVSLAQASVAAGAEGLVQLNGTQKGVSYQLRLDGANTLINLPGYHLTDRGIETVRLEVDLVVEDQGNPVLLLPTGPIPQPTTFNILASKTITGVSAQLDSKASLLVS